MAERNDIPQLNTLYTSNALSPSGQWQLGSEWTLNGKKYIFVVVKKGEYIRQGDAVYVNGEGEAITVQSTAKLVSAVAAWDVEAINQAQYTLVLIKGRSVNVAFTNTAIGANQPSNACFEGMNLVPHANGAFRMVNTQFVLMKDATVTVSNVCQYVVISEAAAGNCNTFGTIGDIISTNIGIYGVIAGFPNNSTIALIVSGTPVGITTSKTNVNIAMTVGGNRANLACTSANIQWRMTVGGTTGFPLNTPVGSNNCCLFNSINVSSAGVNQYVNTCVAGKLIKVGDICTIAGDTGYSSRTVISVTNVGTYVLNAAPTADTVQSLGYGINVNSQFAVANINLL
jgi:hypothetical protein